MALVAVWQIIYQNDLGNILGNQTGYPLTCFITYIFTTIYLEISKIIRIFANIIYVSYAKQRDCIISWQ